MADADDSRLKKLAESQLLILVHRFMGVVGVPLIVALVGWFAITFDDMRFSVKNMQKDFIQVERNLRLLNMKVFGFDLLGERIEDVKPH